MLGQGRRTAVTPEGTTVEIPQGADSVRKYFTRDGSGLVEREQDGVTIISRDAAE
jgi:multidrug efflux pump